VTTDRARDRLNGVATDGAAIGSGPSSSVPPLFTIRALFARMGGPILLPSPKVTRDTLIYLLFLSGAIVL
jgi:hypothetical protein